MLSYGVIFSDGMESDFLQCNSGAIAHVCAEEQSARLVVSCESPMRVTVDMVIFTIQSGALRVLLVKRAAALFQGQFAIPGGFVHEDEDLDQAGLRELREETGVPMCTGSNPASISIVITTQSIATELSTPAQFLASGPWRNWHTQLPQEQPFVGSNPTRPTRIPLFLDNLDGEWAGR
jgi:hypothetical protein